jgi:hypothetical protein
MTKEKAPLKARTRKTPASKVIGTTSDGVKILRAKAKPKHFTSKQIRATIDGIMMRGSSGRS